MGVKERIIAFIEHKKLSQAKFEQAVGLSNGFVNNIGKSIRGDSLDKISMTYPELNKSWVLLDDGEMLLNKMLVKPGNEYIPKDELKKKDDPEAKIFTDDKQSPYKLEKPDKQTTTPYFPDVNASAGLDFLADNGHNYSIPISIPNVDAEAFINVFGDSMYPKYCSGEIIGIKEVQKDMVFFGHAYVIQMINGEAYIKCIDPGKDDDHWMLRSENPAYHPKQFHLSKIRKVYIIKAVISKITIL